jgi:hypothetical protein
MVEGRSREQRRVQQHASRNHKMKTSCRIVLRFIIPLVLVLPYHVSASWVPPMPSNDIQQATCSILLQHRIPSSSSCLAASALAASEGPSWPAFAQQTPHSGRHFEPSHPAYSTRRRTWLRSRRRRRRRGRFMEGWYYRLTLDDGTSFAVSIVHAFFCKA